MCRRDVQESRQFNSLAGQSFCRQSYKTYSPTVIKAFPSKARKLLQMYKLTFDGTVNGRYIDLVVKVIKWLKYPPQVIHPSIGTISVQSVGAA